MGAGGRRRAWIVFEDAWRKLRTWWGSILGDAALQDSKQLAGKAVTAIRPLASILSHTSPASRADFVTGLEFKTRGFARSAFCGQKDYKKPFWPHKSLPASGRFNGLPSTEAAILKVQCL